MLPTHLKPGKRHVVGTTQDRIWIEIAPEEAKGQSWFTLLLLLQEHPEKGLLWG